MKIVEFGAEDFLSEEANDGNIIVSAMVFFKVEVDKDKGMEKSLIETDKIFEYLESEKFKESVSKELQGS
jgi:hypothetical protein